MFLQVICHSNYQVCRGTIHVLCAMVQRSGHSTCGYHGWSPWRTCLFMFRYGIGLSQEPSRRLYLFSTILYMYSTRLSQCGHMFIWTSQLVRTEISCRRMRTEHLMLPFFFHWFLDGLGFLVWCRCHDRCTPSEFAKLFQFKCERNSDPSQQQVS